MGYAERNENKVKISFESSLCQKLFYVGMYAWLKKNCTIFVNKYTSFVNKYTIFVNKYTIFVNIHNFVNNYTIFVNNCTTFVNTYTKKIEFDVRRGALGGA